MTKKLLRTFFFTTEKIWLRMTEKKWLKYDWNKMTKNRLKNDWEKMTKHWQKNDQKNDNINEK